MGLDAGVGVKLTVLGSSAMFSTLERASSGYLLELDGRRIWMDAGGGTWRNLLGHIDYQGLDGIILSHRHPDHTIDVFQIFHARHYGEREPMVPIPLWAPLETVDTIVNYSEDIAKAFDLTPVTAADSLDVGRARLTFTRMAHPPETLGVRIESADGVIAYSSDTGPGADFEALADGADLFVCEATFQDSDREWEGHLSAAQAGEIASRVGARRMLLTHLPSGRDLQLSVEQARRSCENIDVSLAQDGMTLELPR